MSLISSENLQAKDIQEEISFQKENTPQKKERKYSSNSSDSDSFISNINAEIKNFVENEENLSFSSNSDQESPYKKSDIEYLLDSRFWKADKNSTYDNEYNPEKKIFGLKKSKNYGEKNGKSKYEDSNKQSTQGNEDEEMRYEPIHNMSSSETNNSHLNSLGNNENSENEINCDKNSTKEGKNASNNISNNFAEKNSNKEENSKFDLNIGNDYDNNNLMGTNLLFNGSNFTNNLNYNNINENSKFNYPYEPINYMSNQTGSNYYQNSYLSQNYMNFASNYNMASPIGSRNIISLSNNNNKISKNLNENNSDNSEQNVKNDNINGQNNKFLNSTNNGLTKKLNQNQKEIIDLPLILNQNNSPNSPINYNIPKLNLNMTYYPKIQNRNLQIPKQSMDKSNSSNLLPELKDSHNSNTNNNFNFPDKKTKNNNIAVEINSINNNKNNSNGNNSYNFTNNKMKTGFNKNMNNANNNIKGQKGEKQILNLDDIVSGKDTRTTIMIRNIPIKYTDEILNEALKEFQGKYDCLYMPYDYEKNGNKGYAFINFVNPLHILLFYERFNGSKWQHFESPKICELNMAHFQGVNEIQKHAKNFKGLKKPSHNSINENIIIPSKYLSKFKIRFPNMKYENKNKKEFVIKSFE
jgi:hypothetical protein